jgi:hypothetical protein
MEFGIGQKVKTKDSVTIDSLLSYKATKIEGHLNDYRNKRATNRNYRPLP